MNEAIFQDIFLTHRTLENTNKRENTGNNESDVEGLIGKQLVERLSQVIV